MLGREIGRPFERLLNVVVLRTNVANFRWAQSVPHVADAPFLSDPTALGVEPGRQGFIPRLFRGLLQESKD
jgi:hypothetical protein